MNVVTEAPSKLLQSLRSQRPATTLYHYTSVEGLIGIVESKSLWASGIHYLNDTAEYRHAASIVRDFVTRELTSNLDHPWKGLYGMILRGESIYTEEMVFVGSLSEASDKLSQWRGYCPTGGGFCIGFSPELIEKQARTQDFHLLKCQYDLDQQTAICAELISDGCRAAMDAEAGVPEGKKATYNTVGLWHHFVEPLMQIAPALKNPSFEEEREWRLVRGPFDRPDPQVHFRAGKYAVIPYREFVLAGTDSPLQVEEVVIGPNPDPEHAQKSVEYLFQARNVVCEKIANYSGTLRNW
jgi:hypothetical protein